MSDTAIKVENLSKRYRIGIKEEMHDTFVGAMVHMLKQPLRNFQRLRRLSNFDEPSGVTRQVASRNDQSPDDTLWAIKDISFEVTQGEVIGIIGRNGAGKSTLLKVLSRITQPTSGRVTIDGRVASLLEVGTGFHPELTGRDNVYLNGTILGMRKYEIDRKFDEIVDFAGVEKFIDTPVKRYSSGMYVRLAFSVAAHLEPEILIIDEVLAVGDAEFQKKCLGKMGDVAAEGRTVFFVSHNMAAVENLCHRCILLEAGTVNFIGPVSDTIFTYMQSIKGISENLATLKNRSGTGAVRITKIEFANQNNEQIEIAVCGQHLKIKLQFVKYSSLDLSRVLASIAVTTQLGSPVFMLHNRVTGESFGSLPDSGAFVLTIPRLPLPPAHYNISFSLMMDHEYLDYVPDAAELTVAYADYYSSGEVPPITHGVCLVEGHWFIETV